VDELHGLFEKLKTASTRSVKPTRELAELTIFSSAAEANFRRASISSPGGPPNLASILNSPVYGPQLPPATIPAPPASVEDDVEMIDHPGNKAMSDDSSEATLVDMAEPLPSYEESTLSEEPKSLRDEKKLLDPIGLNEDAIMVNGDHAIGETTKFKPPPEKQPPLPPRNKAGLVIQTNDKKTSISDDELWKFGSQQDVTEVIGNVNFRLLCALKPTSIDQQSGEQMDIVRDTLYGANAVYLQKAATLEKKVEAWANLIVFPDFNGPRDIYEALDIVFDEQIVDIDNSTAAQYASISQLPPIIHIQIQRTAYDPVRQIASKNRNAVTFPETIYLDRYMDSSDLDSTLMRRRRETWKWKAQLRVLEARQAALNTTIADVSVKDALIATREYVDKLQEEEIDGVLVDADLAESLEERTMEVTEEIDSITKEIAHLKQALNEQFTDMRQHEYKLQAVFIHRGEAGGGHYWVYIYDFENDIWREYNDEYVTEVRDRRRIFEHQGAMGGTPYYLAYVRSADRKELVEAVCREMPEVQNIDLMDLSQGENTNMSTTGPDFMSLDDDDDDEKGGARHIEHARPRPIRPKPSLSAIAAWDDHQQVGKTGLDANGRPW
jgi:ubiquitin carboxyl-terminal hydrolase 25/28